jgi:hypothetical protein
LENNMDNYKALRAAADGAGDTASVSRLDLAELLQEYDCLRAAGTTKRGKKEYPPEFLEAYDAMKNAGTRWRDGSTPAAAFKQWQARIKAGAAPELVLSGAMRYAAYCKATGCEVKMAQTFFGPGEFYTAEYAVPRNVVPRRLGPSERRERPTLEERRAQANAEAESILNGRPLFDDGMTIDAT